jgi:hypothetical protein
MAPCRSQRLGWHEVALSRRLVQRLPWFYIAACLLLVAWLYRVVLVFDDSGLFRVIGIDWSMYYSQALTLRSGEAQSIYDVSRTDVYLEPLRVFTTNPNEPLAVGPVEYPPVYAWLMIPFTLPPAPAGFALWTVVNLAALTWLARRVAQVLPGLSGIQAMLALLVSFPVAMGLIVGQPTALLACAVAEWYIASRRGQDVRAGLWLSILLLKPQYGILIGPILLWKRRWNAVAGVALGGLAVVGLSALLVGLPTLWTYWNAVAAVAPFSGATLASPGQMINWRALILNLRPSIGPTTGLLLTALLGLISVLGMLLAWRGPWSAAAWHFPFRVTATLLTTVLATYHSHVHGLALAAVPLAASLGDPRIGRITTRALQALPFLPSILVIGVDHGLWRSIIQHQQVDILIWSPLVQVLLVAATASLVADVLRHQPARTLDQTVVEIAPRVHAPV